MKKIEIQGGSDSRTIDTHCYSETKKKCKKMLSEPQTIPSAHIFSKGTYGKIFEEKLFT
jgi:uroporphyrinogen-III decarboxylase